MNSIGEPERQSIVLDLAALGDSPPSSVLGELADAISANESIVVGQCAVDQIEALAAIAAACAVTLVADARQPLPPQYVAVADLELATKQLSTAIEAAPRAAVILHDLLRTSSQLDVRSGLQAESAAYSMLLAGPEFAAWRSSRVGRPDPGPAEPAVLVARDGDTLAVTLNRPERHNAFSRWVRDAACDALDIALLDPSVTSVRLSGAGPSFCSGGDLDEFGSQPDVVLGHLIRLDRSVGWRLHRLADQTTAELHGACVGAGIELPAFASDVVAADGTWFQLPEIAMGLIPGAGGTVSLPRRIGRWRTAWLALTGTRLDLATAVDWGLVDRVG